MFRITLEHFQVIKTYVKHRHWHLTRLPFKYILIYNTRVHTYIYVISIFMHLLKPYIQSSYENTHINKKKIRYSEKKTHKLNLIKAGG